MNVKWLNSNTKSLFQSFSANLPIDGKTKPVLFNLRYLEATGKWYLSMFDSETGKPYFSYVPVIACIDDFNDLILPFSYKNIGFVVCAPDVEETVSVSPQKDNLGQFGIVWGDSYA